MTSQDLTTHRRANRDQEVGRARALARWLDDKYLDPLVGFLFPGIGDLLGSSLGLYIVGIAIRRGLPAIVLARMLLNLAIDAAVGAIPVAGDIFDLAFKANRRNMRLLEARHATGRSSPGDWVFVGGALLLLLIALLLPVFLLVKLLQALF
jgi:hypothetical protein